MLSWRSSRNLLMSRQSGCSIHWRFLGVHAVVTWQDGLGDGGWRAELMWGEGGLQLEGPAKAISGREFQQLGHLGTQSLPRKATSNTWDASYVMGTCSGLSRPYLNSHNNRAREVLLLFLCEGGVLRWSLRSILLWTYPALPHDCSYHGFHPHD